MKQRPTARGWPLTGAAGFPSRNPPTGTFFVGGPGRLSIGSACLSEAALIRARAHGAVRVHEAAHAVGALACGLTLGPTTLSPPGCWIATPPDSDLDGLVAYAIAVAAGAAAEMEFVDVPSTGSGMDDAKVRRLLRAAGHAAREPRVRDVAALLVRQHRPAIARVAWALLWRGSLTAAEAAAIAAVPSAGGWVTAVVWDG